MSGNAEKDCSGKANPKFFGRAASNISNISRNSGNSGGTQNGFRVKKHINKRQAHYEMALGSVNVDELARMDQALLDMTKNLYRRPSVSAYRTEQTPRQLARMTSMHKLPVLENSKGVPHSLSTSRGFHQSFVLKTNPGGSSGNYLGSRGSSFSLNRAESMAHEQISETPAKPAGRSKIVELTGQESTSLPSFVRHKMFSQSAADVLTPRPSPIHAKETPLRLRQPRLKSSPVSATDVSPGHPINESEYGGGMGKYSEVGSSALRLSTKEDEACDDVVGEDDSEGELEYPGETGKADDSDSFGSSVHHVETSSGEDYDSMESVMGHRGSPRPPMVTNRGYALANAGEPQHLLTAGTPLIDTFAAGVSKLIRHFSKEEMEQHSDGEETIFVVSGSKSLDNSDTELSENVALHDNDSEGVTRDIPVVPTSTDTASTDRELPELELAQSSVSQVSDLGNPLDITSTAATAPSLGPEKSDRSEISQVVYHEKSGGSSIFGGSVGEERRNLLANMPTRERLLRAAMHIRDAMHERPIKDQRPGILASQIYAYQHSWVVAAIMRIVVIAHLALVLFEPSSSRFTGDAYPWSLSPYDCTTVTPTDDGIVNPLDCFHKLTPAHTRTVCLAVESFFVLIYVADMCLSAYTHGWADTLGVFTPKHCSTVDVTIIRKSLVWNRARIFTVTVMILDLALSWNFNSFRISRVLRPVIFVFKSRELRRWMYLILSTLPKITGLALLIFSFIAVYAIVGVLLFSGQDFYSGGRYDYANFDNFGTATVSLYVLMTSENFPYIMYPSYDADVGKGSRFFAIFFVSFVLVIMFFLANLAVPYLFGSFKKSHVEEALTGRIVERISLLASFQLLDFEARGFIELNRFRQLMRLMRRDLFWSDGSEKVTGMVEFMFDELCMSRPGKCFPLDFFQISEVILTEFEVPEEKVFPGLKVLLRSAHCLSSIVTSKWTEACVLTLVLVNTILLAFYSKGGTYNSNIIAASRIFIFVFAVEICIKILGQGFYKFLSLWKNKYDFVIVVSATFVSIYELVYENNSMFVNPGAILISLRALRLIPALGIFDRLHVIAKILPFMYFSMLTVVLIIYIFAIVGMEYFSKRFKHNINIDAYADVNIQFDNFVGALLSLFQVLVTNNWDDIMYTSMYSTRSVGGPASFFILFHFIAVSLLLQLVIAIYVEAFETFSIVHEEEQIEALPSPLPTPKKLAVHSSTSPYNDCKRCGEYSPLLTSQTDSRKSQLTSWNLSNGRLRLQSSGSTRSIGSSAIPHMKQHHFVVKNPSAPKSAIHSLARKHMKEFEEVEVDRIKALGDFDVSQEMEIRQEHMLKIQCQVELRETALDELKERFERQEQGSVSSRSVIGTDRPSVVSSPTDDGDSISFRVASIASAASQGTVCSFMGSLEDEVESMLNSSTPADAKVLSNKTILK